MGKIYEQVGGRKMGAHCPFIMLHQQVGWFSSGRTILPSEDFLRGLGEIDEADQERGGG